MKSEVLERLDQGIQKVLEDLYYQCTEKQQRFFCQMYGSVKTVPKDKIRWAIQQCERTIEKNKKEVHTVLEQVKKKGTEKMCEAVIWHGPGHQSRTHCQKKGIHVVHEAVYGHYDQRARWKGNEAFSSYFDEPPKEEEEIQ